jgi:hypothetical protein
VLSLKQQTAGRHVAPHGHIILILSTPVFALTPKCCVLIVLTNCIVFGLTRPGLKLKIPPLQTIKSWTTHKYITEYALEYSLVAGFKIVKQRVWLSSNFHVHVLKQDVFTLNYSFIPSHLTNCQCHFPFTSILKFW